MLLVYFYIKCTKFEMTKILTMKQKKRIMLFLLRNCMHAYKYVRATRFHTYCTYCKEELVDFLSHLLYLIVDAKTSCLIKKCISFPL